MKALNAAAQQSHDERARLRNKYMKASTADGRKGKLPMGVRWWLKYIMIARGKSPFTNLTDSSALNAKIEAEQLLMDFVIWLMTTAPSGVQISAKTAQKYVNQLRNWHLKEMRTELCGGLERHHIKALIWGLASTIQQPAPKKRWGVRTQDLAKVLRLYLSSDSIEDVNWSAALAVGFCGLMRGAEFAVQDGETFNHLKHLTRADLKIYINSQGQKEAIIMMRPAKGQASQGKWTPLTLGGGGSLIDPVALLERMLALDPVPPEMESTTPLFRRGNLQAIKVTEVRQLIKVLMGMIGWDPEKFGAHSLRIGGATAAMEGNLPPDVIRVAGRWSSDCYRIYTKATLGGTARIARVVGSTPFEDMERYDFSEEDIELLLTPLEKQNLGAPMIDADMLADVSAAEEED